MNAQRLTRPTPIGGASLIDLPEYIINTFLPGAQPLLARYPKLFKVLGVVLALYYFGPLARLQTLWKQFSSLLIATVEIASDEDLFGYMTSYVAGRRTIRADQSLTAISNPPQESKAARRRRGEDSEEGGKGGSEDPKIKYEQSMGIQLFMHKRRLFFVSRTYGEGHTYTGNRYKRLEMLNISCLGRSPTPIQELIEDVYYMHKDKERSLTIIRRPYTSSFGSKFNWSRLTSKPRRALDTVILEADQKEKVLNDVEEYMDEATSAFYGNHGIPYRRGYLFHGPPGVGKTSFALALASRFNLDVYVLTLLDHEMTDSDLMSLMNQLPSRSLLLLEDIDTAGLSRKNRLSAPSRGGRRKGKKGHPGAVSTSKDSADVPESDDELSSGTTTRVTLSGLLNAIDGVAAPEGHVLIMTTNKPHELDEALVRAGRISVRVEFKNASKVQAEEIFLRMFVDFPPAPPPVPKDTHASKATRSRASWVFEGPTPTPPTAELKAQAKKFSEMVPELLFSPADLQDYLLMHKKDPAEALTELPKWMEETLEDRKSRDDEKEFERDLRRQKKEEEKKQFRKEIAEAIKEEGALKKLEEEIANEDRGIPEDEDEDEDDEEGQEEKPAKKEGRGKHEGKLVEKIPSTKQKDAGDEKGSAAEADKDDVTG